MWIALLCGMRVALIQRIKDILPQHVRVVMWTALTVAVRMRSVIHQGLDSLFVSEHLPPVPPTSWCTLRSPSIAFSADPPLAVLDWLAALRSATLLAAQAKPWRDSGSTTRQYGFREQPIMQQ